jgi:hypothetical protein
MKPSIIILLVALILTIVSMVLLYKWGKKLIKKQEDTRAEMNQNKQYHSMLIIDKKQLRLKKSGLPQSVIDQAPWYQRNNYVSVVKAKVGPQIMVLLCDREIFDMIPVKKEVKAVVSGLYIIDVKGIRGPLEVTKKEKKGLFARLRNK